MRPLFSQTEWPKLAVYDIESDFWVEVKLICHLDEYGNKLQFATIGEYLDWLFAHFPGDTVWAHAGGHYDHRFLIFEAHAREMGFRTAISGGSIVILTLTDNNGRSIKFGDSYRLMPDSLEKIGKTVNLPKIELDPSRIHEHNPADVLDYCFRDCEIVLRGLQLMRQRLTSVGADFAFTLASIAARYNRRSPAIDFTKFTKRVKGKWVRTADTERWDGLCYDAYFGGRCDVFEMGLKEHNYIMPGPFYWYDIVSSYPTSMLEPLPLYYEGFYTLPSRVGIDAFLDTCGITQCEIDIPVDFITCIPVKDITGRVTFPTGRHRGRWTNIELQEAIKHGAKVLSITGQWRFKPVPFMRGFVQTFYKLRQEAKNANDEFGSYAYKILLNSAYGKLVETIDRKSYINTKEIAAAQMQGGKIEATPTQGVFAVISQEVGPFDIARRGPI